MRSGVKWQALSSMTQLRIDHASNNTGAELLALVGLKHLQKVESVCSCRPAMEHDVRWFAAFVHQMALQRSSVEIIINEGSVADAIADMLKIANFDWSIEHNSYSSNILAVTLCGSCNACFDTYKSHACDVFVPGIELQGNADGIQDSRFGAFSLAWQNWLNQSSVNDQNPTSKPEKNCSLGITACVRTVNASCSTNFPKRPV